MIGANLNIILKPSSLISYLRIGGRVMKIRQKTKRMLVLILAFAMAMTTVPINGKAVGKKNAANKILLSSNKITLIKGKAKTLKVKNIPLSKVSQKVTWISSNRGTADVSSKGKVRAKKAGKATITAKLKGNSKIKAICKVVVYNKTKELKLLSNSAYTLNIGKSIKLKAKAKGAGSIQPITWKSDNPSVAAISKKGRVKTVSAGTAAMTASSGGKKVIVKINVINTDDVKIYYTANFVSAATDVVNMPSEQKVLSGGHVIKPADPTRDGYVFGGWFKDTELTVAYDFTEEVIGNVTLYAKWIKNETATPEPEATPESIATPEPEATSEPTATPQSTMYYGPSSFFPTRPSGVVPTAAPTTVPATPEPIKSYNVTFDLNDNSRGIYEIQTVDVGEAAVLPTKPTRDLYKFTGWYLEPSAVTRYDFATPVTDDLVLYAGWGSPDGNTDMLYAASDTEETDYSVTNIEVDDKMVHVTINTNSSCGLLVEFYDDLIGLDGDWTEDNLEKCLQSEPVTSVATQTPEYGELIKVSIPIDTVLPDSYLVSAKLVALDSDGGIGDLCDAYVCVDYTAKYLAFDEKTVTDFPDNQVVNFDEDTGNNFGVLSKDVKKISAGETINKLDVTTDFDESEDSFNIQCTYKFSNPDASISGLSEGDMVYITGTSYLFKIGSITKNADGSVAYTESSDVMLTDFYEFLKADLSQDRNDIQPQMEIIDADANASGTFGGDIEIKLSDHFEVSGHLSGQLKAGIKIVYDAKLFRKDYIECNVTTATGVKLGITLKISADNEEKVEKAMKEIPLPKIPIPTPIAGLKIAIKTGIPVEVEASGSISFEYNLEQTAGFKYNSDTGREDIKEKSEAVSLKAEGKIEMKAGPKFTIGIEFLEEVVKVELGAQAGVKVSATAEAGSDDLSDQIESKHACYLCVSGNVKWFIDVNIKMSYNVCDILKGEVFKIQILDLEGDSRECFISRANSEDSMFGGRIVFGWGPCPNKSYRTEVKLSNINGDIIDGKSIKIEKNGREVANQKSSFVTYLHNGTYQASAELDSGGVSKSFVVNNNKQTVVLSPSSQNGNIAGHVRSSENGGNIGDANVKVSQGELTITSAKTNGDGNFSCSVPDGTFLIEITKDGYIPFSSYEKIENGQPTYMQEIDLIPGRGMGGFRGTITDAVTGEAVEGVKLQLKSGWNNENGKILREIKTGSNGKFRYGARTLANIVLGIPCGNYTLTVIKEGYQRMSFNIIVRPGEDNSSPEQNAVISPEFSGGAEGSDLYRIVLTWGENPEDLDSHVVGTLPNGNSFHTYFSDMSAYDSSNDILICALDRDDINGYGTETITLNATGNKPYYYYIYHYAGVGSINTSSAQIKVYHGTDPVRTFNVPTGVGSGLYWNVFAIVDGRLIVNNTIDSDSILDYADSGEKRMIENQSISEFSIEDVESKVQYK